MIFDVLQQSAFPLATVFSYLTILSCINIIHGLLYSHSYVISKTAAPKCLPHFSCEKVAVDCWPKILWFLFMDPANSPFLIHDIFLVTTWLAV